ncbi:hypothetical protein [Streptomyces sp. G1]|uniref:hypothetical protein n=1 Tax=Streptomyces sp. G1 TaxID=361572 RepID=UPI00202E8522|nr:hypothetical protein [Streptomyces sp. G1]MCM1977173.1 hypothetical protein [Streptomyces sp. G1]
MNKCPICGNPFPCLDHAASTTTSKAARNRVVLAAAVAAVLLTVLSGCNEKHSEPFKDAPRSGTDNGAPADVIRMPDGFSNAATKCDHGNRLYIAYHGDSPYAAVAVVAQDPTCR